MAFPANGHWTKKTAQRLPTRANSPGPRPSPPINDFEAVDKYFYLPPTKAAQTNVLLMRKELGKTKPASHPLMPDDYSYGGLPPTKMKVDINNVGVAGGMGPVCVETLHHFVSSVLVGLVRCVVPHASEC